MFPLHRHRLGTLLLLPALLVAGCGEEPTPPRLIGFSPPVLTVPTEETLEVSIGYEENDADLEDFQWQVEAGAIEGNGAPIITYRAPAEPGDYEISVTATYGDDDTALSSRSVVTVTRAIATAPPAVTATPGEQRAGADQASHAATEQAAADTEAVATQSAGSPEQQTAAREEQAAGTPAAALDQADQALEEAPDAAATENPARQPAATGQASEQPTSALAEQSEPAEAPRQAAAAEVAGEPAAPSQGAAAAAGDSRLDQILARRRLIALVQIDFEPFSFYGADGRRTGFEIDFLREFARRWLGDPSAVTYLPVPADVRIPTLQRGRADLIAAALTKTPERAEQVDFSLTYFKDGQRLLVPEASGIADVCDLQGRTVAAVQGATSIDNIQAAAADCGFELGDDLVTFRRHDDAVQALLKGEVDAFTSDGMALRYYAEGHPLKVVGAPFSEEAYGFAVPKGDDRLRQLIDETLREMAQDGTYAAIYQRWFGDEITPYPLSEAATPVAEAAAPSAEAAAPTAETTPPDQAPGSEPAAVEPSAGAGRTVDTYVVQPGDTLSRIARKYYGNTWATSWQRIYRANRDVIGDDPGRLRIGTTLEIPE